MAYQTLENFKYGLDTRRSELTSQPGTLAVCDNAHINQGGEIEKRKAFVLCGNITNDVVPGYGVEAVQSGLVSFGSAAAPGAYPTYPNFSATVPAVSYMRLQHLYGSAMTDVLSSCCFNGKAFVVASFADGNTFCFYNGTLVTDSSDGLIYGSLIGNNNNIATAISTWVNRTTHFTSTTSVNAASIVFTTGTKWSISITTTSVAGVATLNTGGAQPNVNNKTITITGTWAAGDLITISLLPDDTGIVEQAGAGNITGINPTFCYTFGNRIYLLASSSTYFSALGAPRIFNDPNGDGNSFIDMGNYYGIIEDLVSIANYQGKLAFFARQSIQIWQTDADPAKFQQLQVLQNVGTFAKLGTRPLGDLDVFFITDTGLRSLRVRDSSNNAYIADVGSAIDSLLQDVINACTSAELAAICTVIEPKSNRLWLYIPNATLGSQIYVLSYFPTAKITAWSTYQPSIEGQRTLQFTFTPKKFVILDGKVYCRANYSGGDGNDYFFIHDGSTVESGFAVPVEYDSVIATAETPWLDAKKPGVHKSSKGVHISMNSVWTVKAGMSYFDDPPELVEVLKEQDLPTFDQGIIAFTNQGSRFKMQAKTSPTSKVAATLSAMLWFYKEGNELA